MSTMAHRSRVHEHSVLVTTSIVLALCTITILGLREKFMNLNVDVYRDLERVPLSMHTAWLAVALVPAYVVAAVVVKLKWPHRVPVVAVAIGFVALGLLWVVQMFVVGLSPYA